MFFDFVEHGDSVTFYIEDKEFKTSLPEFKKLRDQISFALTNSELVELEKRENEIALQLIKTEGDA